MIIAINSKKTISEKHLSKYKDQTDQRYIRKSLPSERTTLMKNAQDIGDETDTTMVCYNLPFLYRNGSDQPDRKNINKGSV